MKDQEVADNKSQGKSVSVTSIKEFKDHEAVNVKMNNHEMVYNEVNDQEVAENKVKDQQVS